MADVIVALPEEGDVLAEGSAPRKTAKKKQPKKAPKKAAKKKGTKKSKRTVAGSRKKKAKAKKTSARR